MPIFFDWYILNELQHTNQFKLNPIKANDLVIEYLFIYIIYLYLISWNAGDEITRM